MNKKIDLEFELESFSPSNLSLLPTGTNTNISFNINLFDLLFMIGRLTTPAPQYPWDWRNLYSILRYGWAISNDSDFKFTQNVNNIDFRLKALMSEDFGIGFTGLIMRDYFGCHFAGATSTIYYNRPRNTAIRTLATPDFIGIKLDGTRLIFESKGTQTSIINSNNQINNGKIKQVEPFQKFQNFPGFVVGSLLSRTGSAIRSRIKVVDPYEEGNLTDGINTFSAGDILKSHYYRLVIFISGIPWPDNLWNEIGLKGLLKMSHNIHFKETPNGGWWYRTLNLPNIPNLPWIDNEVKAISVEIRLSNKVVELVENGSWNKILEYAKQGIYVSSSN